MKQRTLQQLQIKQNFVHGRFVVGIDPAKDKHQAQLLSPNGLPIGTAFPFPTTFEGFHLKLWRQIQQRMPDLKDTRAELVFAIETSCNLWQTLAHYLTAQGYRTVLISPLSTCHARPSKSGDFSRTDPKDAFLIARLAWEGNFLFPQKHTPEAEALHRLAITYDKLRKDLQQNYSRLRSQIELLFPELLKVLKLGSLTARHLLRRYLLPEDFLKMNLEKESPALMAVSRNQHGRETLLRLQLLARRSLGIAKTPEEARAERLVMNAWLALIDSLEAQIRQVETELVRLSQQTPYHEPLQSLKGISDLLAALFVAELRAPGRFHHWKQVERLAGYNLYVCDSGHYVGRRRISHLGNRRLRWVIYCMLSETSKYVPEVRAKYLRRRLSGHLNRQKNLVACASTLLPLMMALLRQGRCYEDREASQEEVARLEMELEKRKKQPMSRRTPGRGQAVAA